MDRQEIQAPDPPEGKKPYARPEVRVYGTLLDLTGTAFGTAPDGGGPFGLSGGAG